MQDKTAEMASAKSYRWFDRIGLVISAIMLSGIAFQPFALVRPNRIAAAMPVALAGALPVAWSFILLVLIAATIVTLVLRSGPRLKLVVSIVALIAVAAAVGRSATFLMPAGNSYARVSPGGCVWLLCFALCLAAGDALVRLRPSPLSRVAALVMFLAIPAIFLKSGTWDDLSILKEYASRKGAFMNASVMHALLAAGSLFAAAVIGIPVGILIHRRRRLREIVISSLNVIQTIPSMALFGLLIAPLAWIAVNMPGASALGIAGIGPAPAFIALVCYSLLPLVVATVTGLDAVSPTVLDAANGMGMTQRQRLVSIELPLAFPFLLSGVRFVLVQNIGLAVIAGLVGGGGLGIFVFQGISQTATDLVLLGALPVVAMAFTAAILLDALVEMTRVRDPQVAG